ncbi:MAG: SpoIIE family protein phosphatase [Sulfurimonas sp.]|nr:SpoIIE family protein phosphatase [Sulfurimonas sp.]MDD3834768.1 SpoIIE family protein phosphatase [Sulfurimonas sp.]
MQKIDNKTTQNLGPLTLLCVEKEKLTQDFYKIILQEKFESIIFASNAEEGLDIFLQEEVDLIISEPSMGGLEMIEEIRQMDKQIPIILASATKDIDIIIKALQLSVNNFFQKPIDASKILDAIENVAQLITINKYVKKQKELALKALKEKEIYNAYQEELALKKELLIMRNDFSQELIHNSLYKLDIIYQPHDTLSGDAYSARKLNENQMFFMIADGMGKGLSASLSAMLLTSYVNHLIDTKKPVDFKKLIDSAIAYISVLLVDYEVICADFVLIDFSNKLLKYAKFSMPASLLMQNDAEVIRLKSNNPPISPYTDKIEINTCDISEASKFLFFSDGIVENSTFVEDESYGDYIEEDFSSSLTAQEFKEKFMSKIESLDDDTTFIFIAKHN